MTPDDEATPSEIGIEVSLETQPEYITGFPMPIAVTVTNREADSVYPSLPPIARFGGSGQLELQIDGAAHVEVPANRPSREGPPTGFTLRAGEARRASIDPTDWEVELGPGDYVVTVVYHMFPVPIASAPVRFRVIDGGADSIAARALRDANDASEPSWAAFVQYNARTPDPEVLASLTERGRRELRPLLAVHRAIYGPEPLASRALHEFADGPEGPTEAELATLRHELAVQRGDAVSAAGLRAAIGERWSGLGWRLDENDAGRGLLHVLRTIYGAERAAPLPDPAPYVEAAP